MNRIGDDNISYKQTQSTKTAKNEQEQEQELKQ